MSKSATTLVLGFAIGAITVVMYRRLRQVTVEDEPEAIIDRVSQQLQELERRLGSPSKA